MLCYGSVHHFVVANVLLSFGCFAFVAESSAPADRGRQPDSGIWRPPELAALLSSVRSFLGGYCIKELDVINLLQSAGAPLPLLSVDCLCFSLQKASIQASRLRRRFLVESRCTTWSLGLLRVPLSHAHLCPAQGSQTPMTSRAPARLMSWPASGCRACTQALLP